MTAPDTSASNNQTEAGAYQFTFTDIDGAAMPLSQFKGKVILIINTASQCGFTDQYKDMQNLHEAYKDRGLVVIGVPCNQFGKQEPGSEQIISDFVEKQYGVTFPMTSKVAVKGKDAHPFFTWAASKKKGGLIFSSPKWNFHKYLIGPDGTLIKSYGSQVKPSSPKIVDEIERLLKITN